MSSAEQHPDAFPWMEHLGHDDLIELLRDIQEALHTGDREQALTNFNTAIHQWKTTAEVLANPQLAAALTSKDIPGGTA